VENPPPPDQPIEPDNWILGLLAGMLTAGMWGIAAGSAAFWREFNAGLIDTLIELINEAQPPDWLFPQPPSDGDNPTFPPMSPPDFDMPNMGDDSSSQNEPNNGDGTSGPAVVGSNSLDGGGDGAGGGADGDGAGGGADGDGAGGGADGDGAGGGADGDGSGGGADGDGSGGGADGDGSGGGADGGGSGGDGHSGYHKLGQMMVN
jgi:hypothetical protein